MRSDRRHRSPQSRPLAKRSNSMYRRNWSGRNAMDSLGEQALLRLHIASRGALPFPSVPPLCLGSFKVASLKPHRPGEPRGTVHPRIHGHEQAHLQVDAKEQRDLSPARIEIEFMTAIGAASISDLETVPVGRLPGAALSVGCEGVADQFTLVARWRLDREFEWGCCRARAHENLGAAFSECLFDAGDKTAST